MSGSIQELAVEKTKPVVRDIDFFRQDFISISEYV